MEKYTDWFLGIPLMACYDPYITTSSTAQGGGGSFKNRKRIGEIAVSDGCQSKNIDQLTN